MRDVGRGIGNVGRRRIRRLLAVTLLLDMVLYRGCYSNSAIFHMRLRRWCWRWRWRHVICRLMRCWRWYKSCDDRYAILVLLLRWRLEVLRTLLLLIWIRLCWSSPLGLITRLRGAERSMRLALSMLGNVVWSGLNAVGAILRSPR